MGDVAVWENIDEDDILEQAKKFYGSAEEFVREFLRVIDRRKVSPKGEFRWDPQWWMHPEAVARLDDLQRTWKHFQGDGATEMSIWWRDHEDHRMSALLSPVGPIANSIGTARFLGATAAHDPSAGTVP